MSRLHKIIRIPLTRKYLLFFVFLVLGGWYKNAFLPVKEGFYSNTQLYFLFFYPLLGGFLGFLFDKVCRKKFVYSNAFFGVLFSLGLPISTPLSVFVIACFLLFFLNTFFIQKKDWDLHVVVFLHLLLVGYLFFSQQYEYSNLLEKSGLFVYTFLDQLLGFQGSGLFTSSVVLLLVSFLVLCFDYYYKKEIPLTSYGFYLFTLVLYSFWKMDMAFLLTHVFSSTVLFVLAFLAPLDLFSPYSKKRKTMYSFLLGVGILPFSLWTNFYEGVYFSLFLANLLIILLNAIQNRLFRS